jgi:hypothetical protein
MPSCTDIVPEPSLESASSISSVSMPLPSASPTPSHLLSPGPFDDAPKFTFTPPFSSSISISSIPVQLAVNEPEPEPASMSLELDHTPQALSLSPDHSHMPLASPLMPEPVLVALPTYQSFSRSESLGNLKYASPLEFAYTVNLAPSSPSESSSKSSKTIPLPALPLEV